jgi:proline iminopeptidase
LSGNTTENLIADIERLRVQLTVEQWLVLGGSWGSALALAYAERFPTRVTELILVGVTTGRREDFDWLFRDGLGAFFPEEWERRRSVVPVADREGDIVEAYCRLMQDPDPAIRERAAFAWCLWESATPDWPPVSGLAPRFRDPSFAIAYARLSWVLVNGRFDFQAPLAGAWTLHRLWPRSELVVVNDAGHAASNPGITAELIRATDRFANG